MASLPSLSSSETATAVFYEEQQEIFLPPKSREERFVLVLGRNNTNARYRCPTCQHNFSGGNQKIRVHITGVREGGSSVKPCTNPNPEALAFCSAPRKPQSKRKDEDTSDQGRKKLQKSERNMEDAFLEAWNLLHNPSKFASVSCVEAGGVVDESGQSNGLVVHETVLRMFDEYGVEKPEDLGLLDPVHVLKLSEVLKVVPKKIFLDLLDVAPPQHTEL